MNNHFAIARVARIAVAALFAGGAASAQEYFPLATGNSWTYRVMSERQPPLAQRVTVGEAVEAAGKLWFEVTWFGGRKVRLRSDAGRVYALEEGAEKPWYWFGAAQGDSYETAVDPCARAARVDRERAPQDTPLGRVEAAQHLRFAGPCADAGVTSQAWAEGVGLLRHEETTIIGPRVYELVRAQVYGWELEMPAASFTAAVDRATAARIYVRAVLRNKTRAPLPVKFASGQTYDFVIRDAEGREVARAAERAVFTAGVRDVEFAEGDTEWSDTVDVAGRVSAGKYALEAYLATVGSVRQYAAAVGFEVKPE